MRRERLLWFLLLQPRADLLRIERLGHRMLHTTARRELLPNRLSQVQIAIEI